MNEFFVYKAENLCSRTKNLFIKILSFFRNELNKNSYYQYRVFKILLYGWVILNTLILLPAHKHFWGEYSFIHDINFNSLSFIKKITYFLFHPWISDYYLFFIFLQIIFSTLAVLNIYPKLSALLVFILTFNLSYKIHTTLDGGNNLIHLLLFYSIFIDPNRKRSSNPNSILKVFFHYMGKASFFMARIQLCLVYFVAGHFKLSGDLWAKGVALYYTFNVDEYTHPFLQNLVNKFPFISVLGSYFTLAYQLTFPFLIWFPKLRPAFLIMGTLLHLGISLGMGLVFFGFAMIIAYSLFYTNQTARNLFFNLTFNNSLLVGIDEKCAICNKFKKFITLFDWFKNIEFDHARKPENSLLLKIDEKERVRRIFVYDYGQNIYFSGMKGIEVMLKNTVLKPFYPLLAILNFIGIGEFIYDKAFHNGFLRKKCSKEKCI